MSGCHNPDVSYYGNLSNERPARPLSQDLAKENDKHMIEILRETEERIKRHITECKREVIKELESMQQITHAPYKRATKKEQKADIIYDDQC